MKTLTYSEACYHRLHIASFAFPYGLGLEADAKLIFVSCSNARQYISRVVFWLEGRLRCLPVECNQLFYCALPREGDGSSYQLVDDLGKMVFPGTYDTVYDAKPFKREGKNARHRWRLIFYRIRSLLALW